MKIIKTEKTASNGISPEKGETVSEIVENKDSPNKKFGIKNSKEEIKMDTETHENEVKPSVSPAKTSSFFGKKCYFWSSVLQLFLIPKESMCRQFCY